MKISKENVEELINIDLFNSMLELEEEDKEKVKKVFRGG